MIAVIDYGMGNLRSVEKALQQAGAKIKVTSKPADVAGCDKLVLPGVGAFGDAMKELKGLRLVAPIKDAINRGIPFLGLCLGAQLLFDKSDESPGVKGLSVLGGRVKKFNFRGKSLKVPHMGWNSIQGSGFRGQGAGILNGVPEGSYMYFVHSYYMKPDDKDIVFTTTEYGSGFVSGVRRGNLYGFQFHPEKSQALGLKILGNFVKL
ncbi:MAG: imidazole glycerol phosphate synthase subunit HisH [Candidatus Omnitrophica bacterium]|nr:imidazole glycerol phosphate synthase subunit HisH [Candidatus Omnitrophota bacterium]